MKTMMISLNAMAIVFLSTHLDAGGPLEPNTEAFIQTLAAKGGPTNLYTLHVSENHDSASRIACIPTRKPHTHSAGYRCAVYSCTRLQDQAMLSYEIPSPFESSISRSSRSRISQ
jgi:hypothetical protein